MMAEVVATTCPNCGGLVDLDTVAVGAKTDCPDCGTLLEVRSIDPLELIRSEDPDVVPFPEEDEYGGA